MKRAVRSKCVYYVLSDQEVMFISSSNKSLMSTAIALATFALCLAGTIAKPIGRLSTTSPSTNPASGPTTRPLADLLTGTYRGTVVDDDLVVPCVTRFDSYRGKVTGEYTVRTGEDAYKGTLTDFVLVDQVKLLCRFKWHDKHGEGILTIQVTTDGKHFAGSWGKEIVLDELIWNGERDDTRDRSKGTSGSSR